MPRARRSPASAARARMILTARVCQRTPHLAGCMQVVPYRRVPMPHRPRYVTSGARDRTRQPLCVVTSSGLGGRPHGDASPRRCAGRHPRRCRARDLERPAGPRARTCAVGASSAGAPGNREGVALGENAPRSRPASGGATAVRADQEVCRRTEADPSRRRRSSAQGRRRLAPGGRPERLRHRCRERSVAAFMASDLRGVSSGTARSDRSERHHDVVRAPRRIPRVHARCRAARIGSRLGLRAAQPLQDCAVVRRPRL
jgi:hypothetical protein